jgi:hypothetical protein
VEILDRQIEEAGSPSHSGEEGKSLQKHILGSMDIQKYLLNK